MLESRSNGVCSWSIRTRACSSFSFIGFLWVGGQPDAGVHPAWSGRPIRSSEEETKSRWRGIFEGGLGDLFAADFFADELQRLEVVNRTSGRARDLAYLHLAKRGDRPVFCQTVINVAVENTLSLAM